MIIATNAPTCTPVKTNEIGELKEVRPNEAMLSSGQRNMEFALLLLY
jgi:hypothetical protein